MPLTLLPTTISSAPLVGALNYDVLTQVILYMETPASGDFQINFRGNSTTTLATAVPVGNTLATLLHIKTGATPYNLTAVTVDGVVPEIRGWLADAIPSVTVPNKIYQLPINISQTAPGTFIVY